MSTPVQEAPLEFNEPEGLSPRGTVIVLAGRGESADVYRRLGLRLASDSYRVRILTEPGAGPERISELLDGAVAPFVLAGSDVGALRAARLAEDEVIDLDGLILAGLPVGSVADAFADWDQELEVRTACPVHRGRLSGGIVEPGALAQPLPPELHDAPGPAGITVPGLGVHGGADGITPAAEARRWLADVPVLEFATVVDGRHDAFNDATHRSVAATIVLWLERLRNGADLTRIVELEDSEQS